MNDENNEKWPKELEERIFELDTTKLQNWPEGVTIAKPASEMYVKLMKSTNNKYEVRISGHILKNRVEYASSYEKLTREAYNMIVKDFEEGKYTNAWTSGHNPGAVIELEMYPIYFDHLRGLFNGEITEVKK